MDDALVWGAQVLGALQAPVLALGATLAWVWEVEVWRESKVQVQVMQALQVKVEAMKEMPMNKVTAKDMPMNKVARNDMPMKVGATKNL